MVMVAGLSVEAANTDSAQRGPSTRYTLRGGRRMNAAAATATAGLVMLVAGGQVAHRTQVMTVM